MNRSYHTVTHGLSTVLLALVLIVLGGLSVVAQDATPVTDVTPPGETSSPPDAVATSGDEPALPPASPEAELGIQAQAGALAAEGTVVVTVLDENDQVLPGACLMVRPAPGNNQPLPPTSFLCDGRDDGAADGIVSFALLPGDYFVVASQSPEGYVSGTQEAFTIEEGMTVQITLRLQPGGRTVLVTTVNESGIAVGSACVGIFADSGGGQPGALISSNCDAPQGDPGDGNIYFTGIAPGNYVVVENRPPFGYLLAPNEPFTVPASGTEPVIVTLVHQSVESPGNLVVNKVDENGAPLAGACFSVWQDVGGGQRGSFVTQRCDYEDGYDGQLVYSGLAPGSYVLVEYHAPDGYINGVEGQAIVVADAPTTVTIPNSPGGSNVTVETVDASTGEFLTGACYVVHYDDGGGQPGGVLEGRCDSSDGAEDGVTPFTGLPEGDYVLVQSLAPEGYHVASPSQFSVDGMADKALSVQNTPVMSVDQIVEAIIRIIKEILAQSASA